MDCIKFIERHIAHHARRRIQESVLRACYATMGHYLVVGVIVRLARLVGTSRSRLGSAWERAPPQHACSPGSYVEQLVRKPDAGCFAAGDHAPRARSLTKRELLMPHAAAGGAARSLALKLLIIMFCCRSVGRVSHRDRPSDVAWCCCCVCLCSAAAAPTSSRNACI